MDRSWIIPDTRVLMGFSVRMARNMQPSMGAQMGRMEMEQSLHALASVYNVHLEGIAMVGVICFIHLFTVSLKLATRHACIYIAIEAII